MTTPAHVCMIVTTDFIHDRRVRKEASSVLDLGYRLTVIATARPEDALYGNNEDWEAEFSGREFTFRPVSLVGRSRRFSVPLLSTLAALVWAVYSYLKIMFAIFRVRADLYHCHDIDALALARLPAWLHRGKVVFDCHDIMSEIQIVGSMLARLRPVIAFFERRLPQTADAVIAAAPSFASRITADTGIPTTQITQVLNCPQLSRFAPNHSLHATYELEHGAPVLLYLGSLNPDRGLNQLIAVIDALSPEIEVVLRGPGHPDVVAALQDQIDQIATSDRVHLGGFVALDEVQTMLMAATATIIPNRYISEAYNSLPNKLFEAMMAGRSFVCHDIPAMATIVRDEECALVLPDEEPSTMADTLNRLLTEPGLAQRLGANGRRAAEERYNWAAQANQLAAVYARVLGQTA